MELKNVIDFLKNYNGKEINLMEVCGTHTASISENGIQSIISPKIHLISGPGCPVCVTASSYIDKLIDLSKNNVIVTFGDMIRVPGSHSSLYNAKANKADIRLVYSPFDIVKMAENEAEKNFVFAAVGFETTTPIYAVLIEMLIDKNIKNVKLLTALKTMPNAIEALVSLDNKIDGFITPGHVCTVTGLTDYEKLAKKFSLPFVVSGFKGEEILASIYALVKLQNQGKALNLYKSAVAQNGNEKAKKIVSKYFETHNATWRGLGTIPNSGMILKSEFSTFDCGSKDLILDEKFDNNCICSKIIIGKKKPNQCPLFGEFCTPETPKGACMVSSEGSCFHYFVNKRS